MMKKFLVIVGILIAGCNAPKLLPGEGEQLVTSQKALHGQEVFMKSCNKCHPAGKSGLGPSLINKPLPGFMIKFQVRNGLGVMPSFSKKQISKEELDALTAYLKEL